MTPDNLPQAAAAPVPFTVLVLEDEFMTRWAMAEFLRDAGYHVIEAENVDAAVSVFQSGIRPRVVFSDVNMPGNADGHRFSAWLEANHPDIPLILTSADPHEATRAVVGPLRRFVRKPYDLTHIAALIDAFR